MNTITFTYNWNNKLNCKAFTSIRVSDSYMTGHRYKVLLQSGKKITTMGIAEIIDIKEFYLDQLNDFISYLDTGYGINQCMEVIMRMHPEVDFQRKKLKLILFKYISKN